MFGATAIFAIGIAAGLALVVAGVDLFAALGLDDLSDVLPETFTVWTILQNNTRAFVLMILGAVTLGILTILAVFFNGLLIGYVIGPSVTETGIAQTFTLLAPHGILELPALFVAAGVGFRLVHLGINRVLGRRERFLSRPEAIRVGLFVAVGWILLAIAAVLEVHVTPAVYEALFGITPTGGS